MRAVKPFFNVKLKERMEIIPQVITQQHISKGVSYETYKNTIDELLSNNKTTGEDHSESMLDYTKLNVQRMNKWDKIFKPNEKLVRLVKAIDKPTYWIVLTEAWCGDAAQNLPIIAGLASLNLNISLKLLLRDENPDVMDAYLTNGGRSIPKLIVADENLTVMNTWGPRPQPVQDILMEMKDKGDFSYDEFGIEAHTWYAKDRTMTLQKELIELLSK